MKQILLKLSIDVTEHITPKDFANGMKWIKPIVPKFGRMRRIFTGRERG